MTAKLGFVGLGAMGSRLAGRLLAAGYPVIGTNRTRGRAEPLLGRGLQWRDTPREVARDADVTFSMVTDDDALEQVATGPDGIVAGLSAGKVYVDMSTVAPRLSRELAERVARTGAQKLEAPVSGSPAAAEAGALTIMVAGDEPAFERLEPILAELGAKVTWIGPSGSAMLMKLAVNISLAEQMLAFSEGILLAERGGVERKLAASILTDSAVGSPMLKGRASLVLELPEEPLFDVALMRKDLRLVLDQAMELGVSLPGAETAAEVYASARAHGYEHRDIAAVYRTLSEG